MPHRRHLTRHVGTALRKINKTGDGTIASEADAGDAKVLRLQITHVLGVGGGAWSGPKAATVSADLIEGGKVTRHTKINRWSVGGVWGAFKGSCSILDRTTIVISKDLSRWVRDPSYEIKEEAPPKELPHRRRKPIPGRPNKPSRTVTILLCSTKLWEARRFIHGRARERMPSRTA
ncbi:hypothetical protein ACLKMY_26785 [Paraburkholderia mimosarum]|uniref:hypothetical protein n=1 Tax=Paraburkholderia mimosarum TaxID=312026 RepID=UPI0039C04834